MSIDLEERKKQLQELPINNAFEELERIEDTRKKWLKEN